MHVSSLFSQSAMALVIAATATTSANAQSVDPDTAASGNAAGVTSGASSGPDASDIIVTGTRLTGLTAAESAAPIKLVGAEAMSHVGQPNLNQILTQLVPSFTAQGFGGDAANLTLSAALRGLNPNETLVLLNGKRRHGTSNLQVLASPFQGGAAPDLDYITPASIERVEVLEDGASAQYGSDAIAGVINIILKKNPGGQFSATAGQYYKGDGKTASASLNYGVANTNSYFNITGFVRYHDFSQRGGQDIRVLDPVTGLNPAIGALAADYEALKNYPRVNPIVGDARSKFAVGTYNLGTQISDALQVYSFGTVGYRRAESYENIRLPNRIIRSAVLGVDPGTSNALYNATVATNPSFIFSRSGFRPQEAFRELDFGFTAGVKGTLDEWTYDLSATYGLNQARVYTLNSANRALFLDTGGTPTDFYDGKFTNSEFTGNLDVTRKLGDIGLLAAGAEYRDNNYRISSGSPVSYYKTGAQSFPGYSPAASGSHSRHDYAVYGDLALTPVEQLKLDGAVRYEDYSDFGHKLTWKATGRFDFTDQIAIRGTASTGFRAPTLAEEFYTQVNVSPNSAFVQLAANSAAAKVLGIQNLKPEKSTNYSAGVVLRPAPRFTITVDAFQIKLRDRIVGSGEIDGRTDGDLVAQALALSGYTLETFDNSGIVAFVNGPNTRTRGVDVVASLDTDLGSLGRAAFSLSAAYNKTKITRQGVNAAQILGLAGKPQSLFDLQQSSFLTTAQPRLKVIGGVNWTIGAFTIVARETFYTKARAVLNDGGGTFTPTRVKAAGITDLEIDYHANDRITIAGGANNLFNHEPEVEQYIGGETAGGGVVYNPPLSYSPFGINGGYYYARLDVKF